MGVSDPAVALNQLAHLTHYQSDNRDFAADVVGHIDSFIIPKYTQNMPFRLADTYTGLIFERSEVVSLLKIRRDYRAKLDAAVWEAKRLGVPIDPDCPSKRPKLSHLDDFIAEFLAFAMFSHRWRGREPTLDDVRGASHGIYSMNGQDLEEEDEHVRVRHISREELCDIPNGVEKLQEFCCVAAKCGFRWAWSDTCCINKKDYAETSESINCMFLWYRSSHLTIVYLDDVDEVKEGRLPAVKDKDSSPWYEDAEIRTPLPPPGSQMPSDTYVETPQTEPYLSLHDRLRDPTCPQLRTMQPDAQIERPHLKSHLTHNFPSAEESKLRGKYRKLPIWVTRGWTLQEMIASKRLRFYSKRWTLLEEAEDCDTGDAESRFSISSFRYRARLVDHRMNDVWAEALVNTTGVSIEDLVNFKVGTRDVRTRLLWAARRTTTKVEDMAYCLLGIFDVSLPALYGEGPRAFLRLQEELMKRTGDLSLFDWCGHSSSLNSFLARSPECFVVPNLPVPIIDDSSDSVFHMIVNLFRAIFGTVWSGIHAAAHQATVWIRRTMESPPPGHTLVNGELNISLFEHRVRCCKRLENSEAGDRLFYYRLEADGLVDTTVTLASPAHGLSNYPTQYYLCRVWDRHTLDVFQIFLELIGYILQDTWKDFWGSAERDSECCSPVARDEADTPGSRLREEMQAKRKAVMTFFQYPFPVYLIRVEDDRRVRVSTANRAVSVYSMFDFTMPVMTRSVL